MVFSCKGKKAHRAIASMEKIKIGFIKKIFR
jgi:hypothetical protein